MKRPSRNRRSRQRIRRGLERSLFGIRVELLEDRRLLSGASPVAVNDSYQFKEDSSNEVPGLINRWTFDDLSNGVARDSVSGNDAFLVGYSAGAPRSAPGKIGGAITFTQDSNLAETTSPISLSQFSISFWMNISFNNGYARVIATPVGQNLIVMDTSFALPGVGMAGAAVDSMTPAIGVWTHYLISYDQSSSTVKTYRNGEVVAQGSFVEPNTNMRWIFGHNQDFGNSNGSFKGQLDDLRIYNRVLTASDARTVYNDASNVPSVLANDTDPEGDALTAVLVDNVQHGTLDLKSNGTFLYTPAANYNGADTFTYKAFDGLSFSNVATATINLDPVNDPPVAANDSYLVTPGNTLAVAAADGVLKNDIDIDSVNLTASVVTGPTHGTLALATDGSFTFTPAAGFYRDTFTYKVNDGAADSQVATVYLRTTVNAAPSATDDAVSLQENGSFSTEPAANTIAGLVDRWTFDETSGNIAKDVVGGKNATLFNYGATDTKWGPGKVGGALRFGGLHYALTSSAINLNQYTISLWSNLAILSGTNPRLLAVTGSFIIIYNKYEHHGIGPYWVNPTYAPNEPVLGVWEHYAFELDQVTGNVTIFENGVEVAAGTIVPPPAGGKWFLGHSDDPTNGDDQWNGWLDDIRVYNRKLNPREVSLLAAGTDTVIGSVLTNDTDADGDPIAAALVDNVQHGTLLLKTDGTFVYTPALNFYGTDTFTYKANDGQADSNLATVTITVNFVNQAPVAADDNYNTDENTALNIPIDQSVLKNDTDVENDPLTAAKVTGPAHGTLTLNADGSFTYTPATNYSGADSFTYTAKDASLQSNTATVRITVNFVNQPPVAVNDAYQAKQDQTLAPTLGVLANDTDPEADPLTAILVSNVQHGILTLNANGTFTYLPSFLYIGPDSFTYKSNDGKLDSKTVATVAITVVKANHAPTAANDSYYFGSVLTVDAVHGVLANDVDLDNDPLTITVVSPPTKGALSLNQNGSFTYSRFAGALGPDSFSYTLKDALVTSQPATVSLAPALTLATDNVTVNSLPSGSITGYFDVFIHVVGGGSYSAAGYEVSLKPSPAMGGVTFVAADIASAAHPALFTGQTPSFSVVSGRLQVTDALASGGTPLTDGAGLFRVQFSVAAGSYGNFQPGFVIAFTNLSDPIGNALPLGQISPGTIEVHDPPSPKVVGVTLSSTQWSSTFTSGLGGGYSILAADQQLKPAPWTNVDQVSIRFDGDVVVNQDSLLVVGINLPQYSIAAFAYDPSTFTGTWTLAAPIAADKLLLGLAASGPNAVRDAAGTALDGEWTTGVSVYPSGNTHAGGDFLFRLNVLPGDVDQTAAVNIFDTVKTRNQQFTSVGDPTYSPFFDVDGSSSVNIFDTIKVRNLQFTGLPDGEPVIPGPLAAGPLAPLDQAAFADPRNANATAPLQPSPLAAAADLAARDKVFRALQLAAQQQRQQYTAPASMKRPGYQESPSSNSELMELLAVNSLRRQG